jgi:hypothetical protein
VWIERHAGAFPKASNVLKRTLKVNGRFGVDRNSVGASLCKRLNILLGFDDHEMHVDRLLRGFTDGIDNDWADGEVGHETPIHDVDVNPVCTRLIDRLDFSLKAAKIR